MTNSRSRSRPGLSLAVCVFLALGVWIVFGQTRHYDFVNYDDNAGVYQNPDIQQGLSWRGVRWAFSHTYIDNWLPLTVLSHELDCQMYGLDPAGHHLTSVALHGATAILLFLFLQNMTGALGRSAFVAAVFAIHPLRAESVAWVSERKDVLSGLFFVLTLWAYVRYARKGDKFPYILSILFFALGLMSKPMLVTVPFVLLLLDYWPLQRKNWPRLVLEKVPFLILSAAVCIVTLLAQHEATQTVQEISVPARLGNAVLSYATYIWQMIYPVDLAVLYPHPGKNLFALRIAASALALCLVSTGIVMWRRKHPYLLVGWLWYVGMLVPVIGLIQVGDQSHADRYTYLPQIGLYILATWGAAELCARWRQRRIVLGAAAVAILAGLMMVASVQAKYWQDGVSLWSHTAAITSHNEMAENNLANALADQGKVEEAILHYERALQCKPDFAEAEDNLGIALASEGKLNEAIARYEHAELLKPAYADPHYNLANALAGQGKMDEAVAQYKRALQLKPDYAEAEDNLGNALASQGRLDEGIDHYKRALQLKPDYTRALYNLSTALANQGKVSEAIDDLQQALKLATTQHQASAADAIRERLKTYQVAIHP